MLVNSGRRSARRSTRVLGAMKVQVVAVLVGLLVSASTLAQDLECSVGPIGTELGGMEWQVTSCNDGRSLVFVTVEGNPAWPFVFIVYRNVDRSRIVGEGNGSKEHSAAALEDLDAMTERQFDELVQATKRSDTVN